MARIEVFNDGWFGGESRTITDSVANVGDFWNDKITSAKVHEGRWIVYEHTDFRGASTVLEPGTEYPNIAINPGGIDNDTISSLRPI
ncbi:MAG: beta/gamma crystallin family protein [Nostocales cyanobacterium 94392]|nr:beta/gamma crystallin family protein [Nostocales cyanobacterium 94392]